MIWATYFFVGVLFFSLMVLRLTNDSFREDMRSRALELSREHGVSEVRVILQMVAVALLVWVLVWPAMLLKIAERVNDDDF